MPDPDEILERAGFTREIFSRMLTDSHIGACWESRVSGVLSKEWELEPASNSHADKRAYKFVKEVCDNLDMEDIIEGILEARFWGHSEQEIMWDRDGDNIFIREIKKKDQSRFVFDTAGNLKIKTKEKYFEGEEVPEKKILLARNKPSDRNPYGIAVGSRCFWPWTFKHSSLKYWIVFLEKFGTPFLVGTHPRGISDEDKNALLEMLVKMTQDAVAAIPEGSGIEIIESQKSTSALIFEKMKDSMNAEISKGILGQTLTTEVGKVGSYAAGKVHFEVRQDIVDRDTKFVISHINRVIGWLKEFNFADGQAPRLRIFEEQAIKNEQAERDKTLFDMGLKIPASYLYAQYNIPEPKEGEEIVKMVPVPAEANGHTGPESEAEGEEGIEFKESREIESIKRQNFVEKFIESVMKKAGYKKIKEVREGLKKCSSYEEMEKKIGELIDQDNEEVQEMLSKGIFQGELIGRAQVVEETNTPTGDGED